MANFPLHRSGHFPEASVFAELLAHAHRQGMPRGAPFPLVETETA